MALQSWSQLSQNGQTFILLTAISHWPWATLGKRVTLVKLAPGSWGGPSRGWQLWVVCPLHAQWLGQQAFKEGRSGWHITVPTTLGKEFRDLRKKDLKPHQKLYLDMCYISRFTWLHLDLYINVIPLELSLTNLSKMDFFTVLHFFMVLITTWYFNIHLFVYRELSVIPHGI